MMSNRPLPEGLRNVTFKTKVVNSKTRYPDGKIVELVKRKLPNIEDEPVVVQDTDLDGGTDGI